MLTSDFSVPSFDIQEFIVNGALDEAALIIRLRQIRDKVTESKQSPANNFVAEIVASVMKLVQSILNVSRTTTTTSTTTTTTTTTEKPKSKLSETPDSKSLLVPEVDPTKDDFKADTSVEKETITSITISSIETPSFTMEQMATQPTAEVTTKSTLTLATSPATEAIKAMSMASQDTIPTAPEITTVLTAPIVRLLKGQI